MIQLRLYCHIGFYCTENRIVGKVANRGAGFFLLPDSLRCFIRDRPGLLRQFLEALFNNADSVFPLYGLDTFRFPPVEPFENLVLLPGAVGRVILKHQQLGMFQLSFQCKRTAHLFGFFKTGGSDDIDPLGGEVTVDLPVPHGDGAEFRGHDQKRLR